jgi:hypothetical protein
MVAGVILWLIAVEPFAVARGDSRDGRRKKHENPARILATWLPKYGRVAKVLAW